MNIELELKLRQISVLLILTLAATACAQPSKAKPAMPLAPQEVVTLESEDKTPPEWPRVSDSTFLIRHPGFVLLLDTHHRLARWVAYELTREECAGGVSRTDNFKPDPMAPQYTARDSDYKNSGMDRGHLAPAADLAWSGESMQASFYFSNITPQRPEFNRGIWKKLEEQCRSWALEYGSILIATGPVLKDSLPGIGHSNISIPEYHYKAVLDMGSNPPKAIAFLLENKGNPGPLPRFAVTIDSLERLTGIDFFHALPDKLEDLLEAELCRECWSWDVVKPLKRSASEISVRCTGKTLKGEQCKMKTSDPSGRCQYHAEK